MTPFDRGIRWLHDRALALGGFDLAVLVLASGAAASGVRGYRWMPSEALTAESGFWEAGRLLRLLRTPAGFTMATSREEDDS